LEIFKEIWNQLSTLLKWWVIILPWESGIRIRFGKHIKLLAPGIHFRLPYLDSCYRQPIRLNFILLSPQTLTCKTGETITISINVGYLISDVLKVYNSVSELQSAIFGSVQGAISEFISKHDISECNPSLIESHCSTILSSKDWGVTIEELHITSYAIVKTFRLIQDSSWISNNHALDTKI
jgi:regulator of protease activity HflC (stomatin/prohibitin superfamily)